MTNKELINHVAQMQGVSQKTVKAVIDEFIKTVKVETKLDGKMFISNLGTFYTKDLKARVGKSPRTKEEIKIPAKTVLRFRASKATKDKFNK